MRKCAPHTDGPRLLLLLGGLATVGLAGCGAAPVENKVGAAPAETRPQGHAVHPLPHQAAPPESGVGGAAAPPEAFLSEAPAAEAEVEPRYSNPSAALIRLYLARHYIYRSWYPKLGGVEARRGRAATVGTSLPASRQGRSEGREICAAVLSTGVVARAKVSVGSRSWVGCG